MIIYFYYESGESYNRKIRDPRVDFETLVGWGTRNREHYFPIQFSSLGKGNLNFFLPPIYEMNPARTETPCATWMCVMQVGERPPFCINIPLAPPPFRIISQ